ncbi:hypothetical protein ACGFSD_34880 [Streptomyces caniferus]|uniref:hypothetical protein n=1 Tax=Streptomyces caniferus TaxID=285557 RepID=UPI00371524DA
MGRKAKQSHTPAPEARHRTHSPAQRTPPAAGATANNDHGGTGKAQRTGAGRDRAGDAGALRAAGSQAGRAWSRLDCVSSNPRLRTYYEGAGCTVVGEQRANKGDGGNRYAVTLLERRLAR